MKVLNRPMFRMGGPIKEGIMDGIKEPRRKYQQAGFVDPIMDPNLMAIRQQQNLDASKAFQNIFTPKYVSSAQVSSGKEDPPGMFGFSFEEPIKPADLVLGPTTKKIMAENKAKRAEKEAQEFAAKVEKKNQSDFNRDLLPEKEILDPNKDNTDPTPETKKEKVNTILEGLGYNRAQKNALYDAMIKAGQRISRTGLGAENLVSDIIAETSQSYDKPEKLREAANLMKVQQDLKLEQIKEGKDTRSPLQKNAEYLLEAGVVDNNRDAVLAAQGKATEANDIFFEASQKLNASKALDQTALTLGAREKFGKGIVFKNKVPKKYKGEPIEKFLESGAFRGDGLYTADGKIMLIQDGKIKSELIIRGSIEEGLFSFGEDD
jgi:hypothetical protein